MTYQEALDFLRNYEIDGEPYACTYQPGEDDEKYIEALDTLWELVYSLD